MLLSYFSQFVCDCYSSGSDLLCSAVLLGHVGEDLLLLGIFIQLLALLLQLLALLLLLQGAQPQVTQKKQPSLKVFEAVETHGESGLPLLLSLCSDSLLLCSLSATFLLEIRVW